jgi:putative OPT family oligopeptide transporter
VSSDSGPATAILIGSVIACAASIAGDNLQDLFCGSLIGSTPLKQQIMQLVGVASASLVLAPIVSLLVDAYGLGAPTAEHPNPLPAPQATLMQQVADAVFEGDIPWIFFGTGCLFAAAVLGADTWLMWRRYRLRVPILAIALGLYLPFELSAAIFLGGLINVACAATLRRYEPSKLVRAQIMRRSILMSAGIITGESICGILLAIPIVATSNPSVLAVLGVQTASSPGILILAVVAASLYLVTVWPSIRLRILSLV